MTVYLCGHLRTDFQRTGNESFNGKRYTRISTTREKEA